MKRRTFLLGALAAPIAPAMPVPRWPAPPPSAGEFDFVTFAPTVNVDIYFAKRQAMLESVYEPHRWVHDT